MSQSGKNGKASRTQKLGWILLAWMFIGGQALLAAGSIYDYSGGAQNVGETKVPWELISHGAHTWRLLAMRARPDVAGASAIFLAIANVLGLIALILGLLCWSKSKHSSGRLTIAGAVIVVLVYTALNLPYV
jgi:hypothetical protein